MIIKVLAIIIMRFSENNVLGPKYIDIYQFWRFVGGGGVVTWSLLHFFIIIHKNGKRIKSMTYTKIKFYSISIFKPKFLERIIKNVGKKRKEQIVFIILFYA